MKKKIVRKINSKRYYKKIYSHLTNLIQLIITYYRIMHIVLHPIPTLLKIYISFSRIKNKQIKKRNSLFIPR